MFLFKKSDFLEENDFQLNEGGVIQFSFRLLFDLLQDLAENVGKMA